MTKQRTSNRFSSSITFVFLFACLLATDRAAVSAPAAVSVSQEMAQDQETLGMSQSSLSGWFLILWADPNPALGGAAEILYQLDRGGETVRLLLTEELAQLWGGVTGLNGRQVTVHGEWVDRARPGEGRAFRVQDIQLADVAMPPRETGGALTGPKGSIPWISVLCKFADIPDEPEALPYFQGMYDGSFPSLDHYWQEISYGAISLSGSSAVGWYTLPHPWSHYVYDMDGNGDLDADSVALANDCSAVADPDVWFPQYYGINLIFNADLDGYGMGGGMVLSLDGQTKYYAMTWDPPFVYHDIAALTHEMGHGFGLPHSSGDYGNAYDNVWDVMSDTWSNCENLTDPTYGCIGQDTIAFFLDLLGWLPTEHRGYVGVGSQASFVLEHLDRPHTEDYLLVQIPIQGSETEFYTVEARCKVGYDRKLPAEGVIIHKVAKNQWGYWRPRIVDVDGDGDTNNAYFSAGQSFVDAANGILVTVSFAPFANSASAGATSAQPPRSLVAVSPTPMSGHPECDGGVLYCSYLPSVSRPRPQWLVTITNSGK